MSASTESEGSPQGVVPRKLQMEMVRGYTAAVWRCHGGRALHRRRRLADGTRSDLAVCGLYEWPDHWHEELEGSRPECKACREIANPGVE